MRIVSIIATVAVLWAAGPEAARGCPFCGVVGRSLAGRRDAAAVTAVGEADGAAGRDAAGLPAQPFAVRQAIRGRLDGVAPLVTARIEGPVAGTAVLFGDAAPAAPLRWEAVAADESLLAHVAAAPATSLPAAQRLEWFAGRLEHPDRGIAADAFTEFGLAPFDAVRAAAGALDAAKLRAWVEEPAIDQRRRGFYGLALGITAAAETRPDERAASVAVLRRAIEAPASDVRAGFDGLLAGLLVAEGAGGLDFLESCGLCGAEARAGDARHLLAALRFAWESLADTVPRGRVAAATARLLRHPAVAADAAVDLARYQSWGAVSDVARLWKTLGRDDPLVRRAVAGYLAACPLAAAKAELDRLRAEEPDLVRQALEAASLR